MLITLLRIISFLSGWAYFIIWSLSVYPQTFLNHELESVEGFSIDFGIMNVWGYWFYSIYTIGGFIYPHLGTGEVQLNDLFFPTHWFLAASVTLTQVWLFERGTQRKFSLWVLAMLVLEWVLVISVFVLEGIVGLRIDDKYNTFKIAGYWKTLITFFKYWPQVYLNYSRKSTFGLSMPYIWMDFTGGMLSTIQQIVDLIVYNKTMATSSSSTFESFNIIKWFIALLTFVFDSIFFYQHYIQYPVTKKDASERLALLCHKVQ